MGGTYHFAHNYTEEEKQLAETVMTYWVNFAKTGSPVSRYVHCRWRAGENPILFGILFTLKPNKKLTTRINCFHLWSIIFQVRNLYVVIYVNSRLNCRERRGGQGNCRQPMLGSSSLAFSQLLRLSREFSHVYRKIEIPNKTDVGIYKYMNVELGRKSAVSFQGIYFSNCRYSV